MRALPEPEPPSPDTGGSIIDTGSPRNEVPAMAQRPAWRRSSNRPLRLATQARSVIEAAP